jgi:hypothetical protein
MADSLTLDHAGRPSSPCAMPFHTVLASHLANCIAQQRGISPLALDEASAAYKS